MLDSIAIKASDFKICAELTAGVGSIRSSYKLDSPRQVKRGVGSSLTHEKISKADRMG